jgi:hypothetical protein
MATLLVLQAGDFLVLGQICDVELPTGLSVTDSYLADFGFVNVSVDPIGELEIGLSLCRPMNFSIPSTGEVCSTLGPGYLFIPGKTCGTSALFDEAHPLRVNRTAYSPDGGGNGQLAVYVLLNASNDTRLSATVDVACTIGVTTLEPARHRRSWVRGGVYRLYLASETVCPGYGDNPWALQWGFVVAAVFFVAVAVAVASLMRKWYRAAEFAARLGADEVAGVCIYQPLRSDP